MAVGRGARRDASGRCRTRTARRKDGARGQPRSGRARDRRTTRTATMRRRHGHGHGPWHGPHESPTPMTFPLMALAIGAIVAGFVGIPAALGGGNTIEHFLEPSFTAELGCAGAAERGPRAADGGRRSGSRTAAPRTRNTKPNRTCRAVDELGLMAALRADRGDRNRARAEVLRQRVPRSPSSWRSGSLARTGCCRTSTTWTSSTTRRSSPAHSRAGDGLWAVDRNGRRRRRERRRQADHGRRSGFRAYAIAHSSTAS